MLYGPTPSATRSASANAPQLGYLAAGSFASARPSTWSITGERSGRRAATEGGGSFRCAQSTAIGWSLVNGSSPVSIVNTTQASAYWSVWTNACPPEICSGAA